ncbi:Hypothetical protein CINCED_3A022806 [Cinara cedri]|uniref:Uncharacterized protein n=1 Tax=Cinara cedri TaxID=506608 RepID=A0A5E4N3Q6_9HEMI|nr:Hypothetical protein CINCED_3A022806 [Cinara cedri]
MVSMNNLRKFSFSEFIAIKTVNFALPNENFDMYTDKIFPLGFKPVPEDVFKFFKGLYPILHERTYVYRTTHKVAELINLPKYDSEIYETTGRKNPAFKKILDDNNAYEVRDKIIDHLLSNYVMTPKQLDDFQNSLPHAFENYTEYYKKQLITNTEFKHLHYYQNEYNALKYSYFPMFNEVYSLFEERVINIGLTPMIAELFGYCKIIYPIFTDNYRTYSDRIVNYVKNKLKNVQLYKINELKALGYETMPENSFNNFIKKLPHLFEPYDAYKVKLLSEHMTSEEFYSFHIGYFPRFNESRFSYELRMESSGIPFMHKAVFNFFKRIYPRLLETTYDIYITRIDTFVNDQLSKAVDINTLNELRTHILNKLQFSSFYHNLPRFFETHKQYLTRLGPLVSTDESQLNRIVIPQYMFNEIQSFYLPNFFITYQEYTWILRESEMYNELKSVQSIIEMYLPKIMGLYPELCDQFTTYLDTVETRLNDYKSIAMNKKEFDMFFTVFPRPYESYSIYKKRVITPQNNNHLTENDFVSYRRIYPKLSETYLDYVNRLNKYDKKPFSEDAFKFLKAIFPNGTEDINNYLKRDIYDRFDRNLDEQNCLTQTLGVKFMTEEEFMEFNNIYPKQDEHLHDYYLRMNNNSSALPYELFNDILHSAYTAENETKIAFNQRMDTLDLPQFKLEISEEDIRASQRDRSRRDRSDHLKSVSKLFRLRNS